MAAARSRTTSEAPVAGSPAHRLRTGRPAALRRLASAMMSMTAKGGTCARRATFTLFSPVPMASSSPTGRRPGRRSGLVDDLGARRVLLDRLDRLEGRALLRVLLAAREDVAVRRDDAEPELAAL